MNGDHEQQYRTVVNDDGQFSVWPQDRPLPAGWRDAGGSGSRQDCLAHIGRVWDDIRPHRAAPAAPGLPATLLHGFAQSVAQYGDRPAVSHDEHRLTYRELDARSTALAVDLVRRGIGVEDRVALYLERGVDLFVAVLGVLKAGAAYVAVDARYPDARRDYMITGGGCRAALTTPGWGERIAHLDLPVTEWRSTQDEPHAAFDAPAIAAQSAACVLFTSGSSGSPKAIVLEHRNLVNFAYNDGFPALTPTDRTGQVSSVSFDAFHFELWCSLARGAEIVVLPAFADLLAGDLQRELRRHRITAMLAPTVAVNHVVREDRDAFSSLRVLHTGGDVVLPAACRDLLGGSFSGIFVNLYGPSETTTACTAHPVDRLADDADTVPIGTAVDGATIYVLDPELRPVDPGQPGELHVGGAGVGRGYLNDPTLTADRFRPDPFAGDGRRMYATGDLARIRPDGLLDFLGRADDQVKIRGYRVEPRETERALRRHPQARDAAVLAVGNGDERRLVGFVVPYDTIAPRELRAFANSVLPDFMVPAELVVVAEIPGDAHGKRDTAALLQTYADQHSRRGQRTEPDGATEKYLADLWEDVLSVERISATDDFFELGGHSLLAFRVQRAVQRELGVLLEFREILDNGVLRDLAAAVDRRRSAGTR
ncbi:amino acid adenylation domain-containing protein [Catellatospora citrea]|uniref:Carrier domain-containing protein n=1 Tax=Catellatospora citrea TaxID=53366 RepID=A0A8J3KH75_9ACTN|nr:amino acid adenylation domain-containing protein [Catellatospora citrea]RKE05525.1 amino acid adenylation domain-containing protein [Catellatospora citrea]GIF96873.1 hypothetical protein Cci01nite_19670 [Catellatospora citrea]